MLFCLVKEKLQGQGSFD